MNKLSGLLIVALFALVTVAAWGLANRPTPEPAWPRTIQGFAFQPYQKDQDATTGDEPTLAQIDSDLKLLEGKARAVRTYSTLGTLGMSLGAALLITGGVDARDVPFKAVDTIGTGRLFSQVPWLVIIAFAVALVFGVVLAATRFGRYTYAVGSNEEAARRSGIAVDRHLIKIYALSGTLAGLAGFLSLARFSTTTIGGHDTDNLQSIAAVVIGGTSLFGGIGTILGTVFGVFIPAVLQNGFIIVGVQPFWQQVAVGAVLIGAVYLDQLRRRSQHRR